MTTTTTRSSFTRITAALVLTAVLSGCGSLYKPDFQENRPAKYQEAVSQLYGYAVNRLDLSAIPSGARINLDIFGVDPDLRGSIISAPTLTLDGLLSRGNNQFFSDNTRNFGQQGRAGIMGGQDKELVNQKDDRA